jgi:anaerobic magnesium-protoporphyrin IX monomethyl ester cyclase
MMKTIDLLLINPQISFKQKYDPVELEAAQIRADLCKELFKKYRSEYSIPVLGDCASNELIDPPTGMLILASIAKREGFEVALVDFNAIQASKNRKLSNVEIEKELRGFDPYAIGIASFTHNHHISMRILKIAKDCLPNSTTIYGGVHATFTDLNVLRTYRFVDCVVRGEAETIISPLLKIIKKSKLSKKYLTELDGITFKIQRRDDGPPSIIRNRDNHAKPDLNDIPLPDYGLLDREQYRTTPFFHLFGQRGCPYDCVFCANVNFFGQFTVRRKKPERVIEEIKLVQSLFGNKVFLINDDTFTSYKKYAIELCQALEKERFGTCFQVQSRVDRLDDELLRAMRRAQIVYIWLGCESADPSVLRILNKGINPDQIEEACLKVKRNHMDVGGYWLVGCPGETLDSIRQTRTMIASLIDRNLMDVYEQSIFVPYPGTAVYDNPKRFNVRILTHDFRKYREDSLPVVRLEGLTPDDVFNEWLKTTRMTNEIFSNKIKSQQIQVAESSVPHTQRP